VVLPRFAPLIHLLAVARAIPARSAVVKCLLYRGIHRFVSLLPDGFQQVVKQIR